MSLLRAESVNIQLHRDTKRHLRKERDKTETMVQSRAIQQLQVGSSRSSSEGGARIRRIVVLLLLLHRNEVRRCPE